MDEFNVVYLIDDNDNQIKYLKCSVDTLVKFNKVDNIYIIYCHYNINDDCTKKIDLGKYFKNRFNIKNYHLIEFDLSNIDKYFPKLPNVCNERVYYGALCRWFVSSLINKEKIWYFDTDILFNDNIREYLMNIQNNNYLFYGFNRKTYTTKLSLLTKKINIEHTDKINSGILFINNKIYNEMNIFDEILKFYKENSETIYYVNQDAYQYIFDKYKDICKIEKSEIYNVKLTAPYYFNKEFNKIKIFHFNGGDKYNFLYTYLYILNIYDKNRI